VRPSVNRYLQVPGTPENHAASSCVLCLLPLAPSLPRSLSLPHPLSLRRSCVARVCRRSPCTTTLHRPRPPEPSEYSCPCPAHPPRERWPSARLSVSGGAEYCLTRMRYRVQRERAEVMHMRSLPGCFGHQPWHVALVPVRRQRRQQQPQSLLL
jgi:hypothetical protein